MNETSQRRQPGMEGSQPQGQTSNRRQPANPMMQPQPQMPPSSPRLFQSLPEPDPRQMVQALGLAGTADEGGMFQQIMHMLGRR